MTSAYTSLFEIWSGMIPGLESNPLASNPLLTGMERTFGALGDAFGWAPGRELAYAWGELMAASAARQGAQAEYLLAITEAWRKGTERFLAQLATAQGEQVESLIPFLRKWANSVDAAMHEAMQSEQGLLVTARLLRAATHQRQQLQRAVVVASDCLHMPTRADVDEAYREIQQLKRELRSLKKAALAATRSSDAKEPTA